MERRAVGTAADGAVEELANQRRVVHAFEFQMSRWLGTAFPKRYYPAIHRPRGKRVSGHLPVTMMMEPDLIMSVRRMLTTLAASVLVGGPPTPARAQGFP